MVRPSRSHPIMVLPPLTTLTVLCSNAIFMTLFGWFPFSIGRAFLSVDWGAIPQAALTLQNRTVSSSLAGRVDAAALQLIVDHSHSDGLTIAMGYSFIFGLCAVWMGVCISLRRIWPGTKISSSASRASIKRGPWLEGAS